MVFKKLGKAWLASISCGVVNFIDNIPVKESKDDGRSLFLEVIKILPKAFWGAVDRSIMTFFDALLTHDPPEYEGPIDIYPFEAGSDKE